MKEIWAPWRAEYFKIVKDDGCFLCKAFSEDTDRENHVLKRGKTCAVVLNRYPYTGGHLMVAPYRHVDNLKDLTEEESAELMRLTHESIEVLKKAIDPQGFNIGINLGEAAGAGLKDHVHQHIVPRWTGDTNFITVMADVRVVPQSLLDLWDILHEKME